MFKSKIYTAKVNNTYKFVSKIQKRELLKDSVEKGVYELVKVLNDKNYLTFSSCHGHSLLSGIHVDLAFPNKEYAEFFINNFKDIQHVTFKRKINYLDEFYGASDENEVREILNKNFNRDYPEYCLIQLCILNYSEYSNPFSYILSKFLNLDKTYRKVIKRVGDLPTYPF